MSESSRILIGPLRLCYVYVDQPQKDDNGQEKYKVTALIPKDDKKTLNKIYDAIDVAIDNFIDAGKAKSAKGFKKPLMDGDDKDKDDYGVFEDHWYLTIKSNDPPGLVNQRNKPILNRSEIYSGCYAYISVSMFAYDHPKGGKGVGAALNNIMLFKEGERIGGQGGVAAEEEFKDLVKRGRDDDEDEERPRGRRSRDEEEEEKPRGRRSRDEDEEEEKPRGRRSRDDEDEERPRGRRSRD